jgi:hypothetical protein
MLVVHRQNKWDPMVDRRIGQIVFLLIPAAVPSSTAVAAVAAAVAAPASSAAEAAPEAQLQSTKEVT